MRGAWKYVIVNFVLLVLLSISVVTFSVQTDAATDLSIILFTDKKCYSPGTDVIISGQVSRVTGNPVVIQILTPNGNIVVITQVTPNPDGSFSKSISTKSFSEGTWTVRASYSNPTTFASTTFDFGTCPTHYIGPVVAILIVDNIPPLVTPPPDQVVEATGPEGTIVTYPPPTATDNVAVTVGPTCSKPSGEIWPIGKYLRVLCTAEDAAGNVGRASFAVFVQDTTSPSIGPAPGITLEATSPSGAVAIYTVPAFDIVDTSPTVSCLPPSGSLFSIGNNKVTCTATDFSGNPASISFPVIVEDVTPKPVIFNLYLDRYSSSVEAGNPLTVGVNVDFVSGDPQPVQLSCSVPTGYLSCEFDVVSIIPTGHLTMTIFTSESTPADTYDVTIEGRYLSGEIVDEASFSLNVNPLIISDFSLSIHPTSAKINPGETLNPTLYVHASEDEEVTVFLSCVVPSVEISCNLSSTIIHTPANPTIVISTTNTITPDRYEVVFTGSAGSITDETTFALNVVKPVPFSFSLSSNPSSEIIEGGESIKSIISVNQISGMLQDISLACSTNQPSKIKCFITPQTIKPAGTATLTLQTSDSTLAGKYSATIRGIAGDKSATTSVIITVLETEIEEQFDFSLVANPSSAELTPGESYTGSIILQQTGGVQESVTLSCSVSPSDQASCTISSLTLPSGEVELNINTKETIKPGEYEVTITGMGGKIFHEDKFALAIISPAVPPDDNGWTPEETALVIGLGVAAVGGGIAFALKGSLLGTKLATTTVTTPTGTEGSSSSSSTKMESVSDSQQMDVTEKEPGITLQDVDVTISIEFGVEQDDE